MPLRLVLQLPADAQPLARRPAPYCLAACAEVRGFADLSRPPLPVPVARRPAPSCLAACIELSAAPQSNFASLLPSCIAATTTPTVRRPTHGSPAYRCPLCRPHARTVRCNYRWWPACSDYPVCVPLFSPPARTAQCHPLPTSTSCPCDDYTARGARGTFKPSCTTSAPSVIP